MDEETSMDGSKRPLTKDSKLMILFDFIEHAPGIGLISHVTRPTLPTLEEDAVSMMKIYIENNRQLAVRWMGGSTTSAWHLKIYTSIDSSKDTVMRGAKAVLLSDDKDAISNKRQEIIKELSRKKDARVCRSLFPQFEALAQHNQVVSGTQSGQVIDGPTNMIVAGQNQKRSYEDLEQTIIESDAKVLKLELDNKNLNELIETLKKEIVEIKQDPLHLLIETVKEQTSKVQRLIEVGPAIHEIGQSAVGSESLQLTPQSLRSSQQDTPVKFHGSININPSILRSALIKGRTKTTNSGRRLNATVATLLSSWWSDEELSKISLAGKACPSIPGSKPKTKFNEEILEAITQFLIPKWEKWHGVMLTPDAIKVAISDRLLACHTKERKKRLTASTVTNEEDIQSETLSP